MHLAQSELAVVRVEDAISADLVLHWQCLGFELDAVLAGDLRPHVHGRSLLLVRVTELEDDLGIANGKAVDIGDAPSQNECVVVEAEVGSVAKNDLADLGPQAGLAVLYETNTHLLRRALRRACRSRGRLAQR